MIALVTVITITLITITIVESNILIFLFTERLKCRWEDNNEMDLIDIGYTTLVWAKLAQRMIWWLTSLITIV